MFMQAHPGLLESCIGRASRVPGMPPNEQPTERSQLANEFAPHTLATDFAGSAGKKAVLSEHSASIAATTCSHAQITLDQLLRGHTALGVLVRGVLARASPADESSGHPRPRKSAHATRVAAAVPRTPADCSPSGLEPRARIAMP